MSSNLASNIGTSSRGSLTDLVSETGVTVLHVRRSLELEVNSPRCSFRSVIDFASVLAVRRCHITLYGTKFTFHFGEMFFVLLKDANIVLFRRERPDTIRYRRPSPLQVSQMLCSNHRHTRARACRWPLRREQYIMNVQQL